MVTEGRYKVKLSEKLPASDAGRLPTWEQCKAAVLNEDETALERFIYEMEPPRLDDAVEFRAWLEKVVEADSQEIKRLRARVAELETNFAEAFDLLERTVSPEFAESASERTMAPRIAAFLERQRAALQSTGEATHIPACGCTGCHKRAEAFAERVRASITQTERRFDRLVGEAPAPTEAPKQECCPHAASDHDHHGCTQYEWDGRPCECECAALTGKEGER